MISRLFGGRGWYFMQGIILSKLLDFNQLFWLGIPLAVSFIITSVALPLIFAMLRRAGFVRPNFEGYDIPAGVGFIFFLAAMVTVTVSFITWPPWLVKYGLAFVMSIATMSFLGFIDDVIGSAEVRGMRGHFKSFFAGRLTTGALKALGGGVLAILVSGTTVPFREIAVNVLLVVLSINTVNLLDLRPGRAAKGFVLIGIFLAVAGWRRPELVFLAMVMGSILAYIPYDLRARVMMGDTGSNALGVALGLVAVWVLTPPVKLGYLIVLTALNLLAEKYSLTAIIANNRVLSYLDRLWRK